MAETWTDKELMEKRMGALHDEVQAISYGDGVGDFFQKEAELYRLARLGLAAEAVGSENFDEAMDWSTVRDGDRKVYEHIKAFVAHPAWTR